MVKNGNIIYISSDHSIFAFDCNTKKVFQAVINNSDSVPDLKSRYYGLLKSNEGDIWVTSNNRGLCKILLDKETQTLSLVPFVSDKFTKFNVLETENISLYQDKDGIQWLGNQNLQKINLKTGEIKTFKLIDNIDFIGVCSILEDNHENLWLGTGCRFFTNISHEFRTPLSLIQGPVEELLNNPRRTVKERGKLNVVYRNARRLLNLVNQLLDISRIDTTRMKLEIIESDVIGLLRSVTASFNSLAEIRKIDYKCFFPSEHKNTWFDPDKCEKVVTNLMSNAFKFTAQGGTIIFRANYEYSNEQVPVALHFSVQDNGCGIPRESLEKIFDRFYQVEESIRNETGGAGIGLSLARDMVWLMHGEITVTSQSGKGSTFSVQFPLGKEHLD